MRTWPILAVMAFCAVANAQGKDNKAESDKLFNEGITSFNGKDYSTAHQKFSDAYAKFPSPSSLFNMARTELLLEKCPDSISHYRAYLALPDNPRITEQNRANARQDMATCMAKVGRLNVKAPSGTSVFIDGVAAQWVEGEPLDVAPGSHDVQLKNAIGAKTRKVDAPAGQVTFVEWDEAAAPVTNPNPPNTNNPPATTNPTPNPNPPQTPAPAQVWTGGRIGVTVALSVGAAAGLIIGGVFGLSRASATDRITTDQSSIDATRANCSGANAPSTCADLQSAFDDRASATTGQTVSFIAGGVLAVAAAGSVALWYATPIQPKVGLVPTFGPRQAGLLFSTNF